MLGNRTPQSMLGQYCRVFPCFPLAVRNWKISKNCQAKDTTGFMSFLLEIAFFWLRSRYGVANLADNRCQIGHYSPTCNLGTATQQFGTLESWCGEAARRLRTFVQTREAIFGAIERICRISMKENRIRRGVERMDPEGHDRTNTTCVFFRPQPKECLKGPPQRCGIEDAGLVDKVFKVSPKRMAGGYAWEPRSHSRTTGTHSISDLRQESEDSLGALVGLEDVPKHLCPLQSKIRRLKALSLQHNKRRKVFAACGLKSHTSWKNNSGHSATPLEFSTAGTRSIDYPGFPKAENETGLAPKQQQSSRDRVCIEVGEKMQPNGNRVDEDFSSSSRWLKDHAFSRSTPIGLDCLGRRRRFSNFCKYPITDSLY